MIQDVKLGTHKIGTYTYAINKCAFLLGFYLENASTKRSFIRIKVVWPMMIVAVTNFEAFTRQQF